MESRTRRPNQIAVAATSACAALLLVVLWGAATWIGAPFPGFLILENGVVASAGLSSWPALADGRLFQRQVTSYDETKFTEPTELLDYINSQPVGSPILYTFTNRTDTITRAIPTSRFTPSDAFALFGTTLFAAIALLSVSIALIYMAPNAPSSKGCASALAITGTFAATAVDLYGPYHFFRLHAWSECFLGAGAIHMALVFPHRRRVAIHHKYLIQAPYAVSAAIAVTNQGMLYEPGGYTATHLVAIGWASVGFAIMALSQIHAFARPKSAIARQRVAILAIGTLASIAPAALVAIKSSISGGQAPENTISWTGALFPIAVGYAVLKSDLLEIDSVLRRSVNYILLSIVVGALYTALLSISEWLLRDSISNSRILSTIAFSLFLTVTMFPLRDFIQEKVDRYFFRSTYDFRHTVEDLSNSLARMIDLELIKDRIVSTIKETLRPEKVELLVLPENEPTALTEGSTNDSGQPFPLQQEASTAVIVPFQSKERTVAWLKLGRKLSGNAYSSIDRALLQVLANQGAIAIENALAVEKLQDLNRTLERRVFERTHELASALSDLKSTQNQLVQAERLAAVGELAAGVAHEVNNPLNFARNSLRALQQLVGQIAENGSSAPKARSDRENHAANDDFDLQSASSDAHELLEILGSGLDRTARLVQDLRDFASPNRTESSSLLLSSVLTAAVGLIRSETRDRNIDIRFDVCVNEPRITGDPHGLGQVFLNILKNSLDALESTPNGRIEIRIRVGMNPDSVIIEIEDNGSGIAPENAARLFDPFFTTKLPGKGTGLGLALCRRIIQEHCGEIDIARSVGGGAVATISLPIRPDSREAMTYSGISGLFDSGEPTDAQTQEAPNDNLLS